MKAESEPPSQVREQPKLGLVRTSLWSLMATIIKMVSGLFISKTLAVFVGPSGFAIVGQFQNFVQLSRTVAKAGIDTGVTKYTAEYCEKGVDLDALFSTSMRIVLTASAVTGALLITGSFWLALFLLQDASHWYIFALFGFTIVLFSVNSLLLAILIGLQEVKIFVLINIAQSVSALFLTVFLIYVFGLSGALMALVTNQSIVLVVLLWVIRKKKSLAVKKFSQPFRKDEAKRLASFSIMAVVTTIVAPITTIAVRLEITNLLGLTEAGYWQAAWYVSSVYLTVVTTTLTIYYLPRFAALSNPNEIRRELIGGYRVIMPVVVIAALLLFFLKSVVVSVIFSDAFEPMLPLFKWMLVGDVIKIASWLFSYLMLAKAMMRPYIATEIIFSVTFVVLSHVLIQKFGLEGVMYAHSINYLAYFVVVGLVTRSKWKSEKLEKGEQC